MFAHVTDGIVDAVGQPPQVVYDGGRWWDLRDRDLATLALVGWFPVVEAARPADTATTRWEPVFTPAGDTVTQSWVEVNKTQEQIDAETSETNRQTLIDTAKAAYSSNVSAITRLQNFANGTATLTNTQRDTALRDLAGEQARAFRQLNALIRLTANDLLSTDGTAR